MNVYPKLNVNIGGVLWLNCWSGSFEHELGTLHPSDLAVLFDTSLTTVSGAFLQYDGTRLNGSPPNVTLTVGGRESQTVYCVQLPAPTAIEWYNPQGQLVSRDVGGEVNQGAAGGTVARLNFRSYQQDQGGKYECRVTGPGNNLEKLPVCIGECCTLGGCSFFYTTWQFINKSPLWKWSNKLFEMYVVACSVQQ